MARVSTYLNFSRSTEKAFLFYKSVFGGNLPDLSRAYLQKPCIPK